MPPGIPVATVGINGAKNAALLAIEIIAVGDSALSKKLKDERYKNYEKVLEKDKAIAEKI